MRQMNVMSTKWLRRCVGPRPATRSWLTLVSVQKIDHGCCSSSSTLLEQPSDAILAARCTTEYLHMLDSTFMMVTDAKQTDAKQTDASEAARRAIN